MDNLESNQERQENEFQVLKAIYLDDMKNLRENVWNIWQPNDVAITLTPQQGSSGFYKEVYAQVDLHVKCSHDYPDMPPQINLQKSKGLSNQILSQLKLELEDLASSLKGEVMIFELAQHTQKFLHIHNKPPSKSFYEEMVSNKEQQQKDSQQRQKIKEEKERMLLKDEFERRRAALIEEQQRLRRGQKLSQSDILENPNSQTNDQTEANVRSRSSSYIRHSLYRRRRCQSTSESSDGSLCDPDHRKTLLIHFNNKVDRQLYRGKCLGHSTRGSVVYSGVDTTTGELMAICEWTLKLHACISRNDPQDEPSELANIMKQVSSIEQELNYLHKLHHPNLVHLIHMKFHQEKESFVQIYILQEFVIGTTVSLYLNEGISPEGGLLRHLSSGILEALAFLHHNNVVHKDLRDTSVFIDRQGGVKLSDYSIDKRLADLYQACAHDHVEGTSAVTFPPSLGRGGKKGDIYRFGVLVLSLATGSVVTEMIPKIPGNLSSELRDFLSKCLQKDERQRWSAEQLLNHPFVKEPLDRGLSPQQTFDDPEDKSDNRDETPDMDIPFMPANSKGQSRILNEFEVLKWLGKGAFGDVLKVRNKLDGGVYAIKRIALNPKNKQLNKKITREVKLLSRLYHENVVRYYNSWIESATIDPSESTCSLEGDSTELEIASGATSPENRHDVVDQPSEYDRSLPISISIGNCGDQTSSHVEWNAYAAKEIASSEDESTDDEEDWIPFLTRSDSSDGIVFEREGSDSCEVDSASYKEESQSGSNFEERNDSQGIKEIQFMYIQMEFCEKSTLRTAIDSSLCEEQDRLWRLFREVVEGLAHIHQQGMIHRDLKPVNIFLDSNDHVKIGDFGLATTNILTRPHTANGIRLETTEINNTDLSSFMSSQGDGALTGQVGTALYVAPELTSSAAKANYNQKVDIYSLGIILFEMSYHPLSTGMERVKVLAGIRSKEIRFPEDFDEKTCSQNASLIQWLLNHDPSQRPTAHEVLDSELLPAAHLEENDFQECVRHTLAKPQTKTYKLLMASCFDQEVTAAADVTFDMALGGSRGVGLSRTLEYARDKVRKVFERHGAVSLATPLLTPRTPLYDATDTCVRLMTHTGSLVSLPYDLRVPFARYIALNKINKMRRYTIDRVYREKKAFGFHPRELVEGAFDIVSPTSGNVMIEAELLAVIWEAVCEFPALREKNCIIRLNHTALLKAMLLHCGIETEKHNDIYTILSEARDERLTRFQVQTHLISLCLTDNAMQCLFNLIDQDCQISKLQSAFSRIIKRKDEVASLAKQAIEDLKNIITFAEMLGVTCPIVIAPGLVYNVHQYSGMMCQLGCDLKKKRRRGGLNVLAAGGRYDNMLAMFRKTLEVTGVRGEQNQSAAGISISLDQLATAGLLSIPPGTHDVAVAFIGRFYNYKEIKMKLIKDLWAANFKTYLIEHIQALEEIDNECMEKQISHILVFKDNEPGNVRIRTWERDRFQERRVPTNEAVDNLQRALKIGNSEGIEQSSNLPPPIRVEPSSPVISVSFLNEDKLASNRRRLESQILSQVNSIVQRLNGRTPVVVLVLSVEASVIRTLAAHLEFDTSNFDQSLQACIERHPRHKKYLTNVSDDILRARGDIRTVLILYSLNDSFFKVIL